MARKPQKTLRNSTVDVRSVAQDMFYRAIEAKTEAKAVELCRKALDLDPLCVDAFLFLGMRELNSAAAAVELFRDAVGRGERALGGSKGKEAKAFKDMVGHFWGFLETRPYMRAMGRLAEALEMTGQFDEALEVQAEMLRLNPGDNQGVRLPMLATSLLTGNVKVARKVLKAYPNEGSMTFRYARVLERVISADEEGAAKALREAREGWGGAIIEKYLTGKQKMPKQMPELYSPGDESEAIIAADLLIPAYTACPAAVKLLAESL